MFYKYNSVVYQATPVLHAGIFFEGTYLISGDFFLQRFAVMRTKNKTQKVILSLLNTNWAFNTPLIKLHNHNITMTTTVHLCAHAGVVGIRTITAMKTSSNAFGRIEQRSHSWTGLMVRFRFFGKKVSRLNW